MYCEHGSADASALTKYDNGFREPVSPEENTTLLKTKHGATGDGDEPP